MMFNLVEIVMGAARKYTVVDYSFFKVLMITFGILIGIYWAQPILNIIWMLWTIFIISAIWMIYKTVKYSK